MKVSVTTLFIGCFAIFLLFMFFRDMYRKSTVDKCYKVVLAKPIKINGGFRSGYSLEYKYELNHMTYNNSSSIDAGAYLHNGKSAYLNRVYFAKVSCDKPDISFLQLDQLVPKSITRAPINGWDSIPVQKK